MMHHWCAVCHVNQTETDNDPAFPLNWGHGSEFPTLCVCVLCPCLVGRERIMDKG